jgi:DNA (cytosine-5)-methyltransferase 1
LKVLTSIGYSCNISKEIIENGNPKDIQLQAKKMVLKSCDFGVPQNRQRIYIVLWRDGEIERFDYPKACGKETKVGDILEEFPDIKYTISDKLWNGHQRRKIDNTKNGKGFGFGLVTPESPYTNTISARYYKDGSEILIDSGDGKNPRKLTHREAARLQGFPDSFILNKSSTQTYKQLGNSVSVPVISAIAGEIAEII